MWSELLEMGRVIGLDIDLSHIAMNMDNLRKRGAFVNNNIELYEFDQFHDNRDLLDTILNGDKIDIMIDDGAHITEAILATVKSVLPCLAEDFVYFIEDNKFVHTDLRALTQSWCIKSIGELTIAHPYSGGLSVRLS
jgi:hypothetical protein